MNFYEDTAEKTKNYKIAAIICLSFNFLATSIAAYQWFRWAQRFFIGFNSGRSAYIKIEIGLGSYILFVIINILFHVLIGIGLHFLIENYREKVILRQIQFDLLKELKEKNITSIPYTLASL